MKSKTHHDARPSISRKSGFVGWLCVFAVGLVVPAFSQTSYVPYTFTALPGALDPYGLAVDGGGNVYVANMFGDGRGSVQEFTPSGTNWVESTLAIWDTI